MGKGFTLIEMMIAISVMVVIVMGGTLVFFRSLGSSGVNQAQVNTIATSNQVMSAIENNIRYQKIRTVSDGVNTYDRNACVQAGKTSGSVSGDTLEVYDQYDLTIYSLIDEKISSNSSVISSPNLEVSSINFEWFCVQGSTDILRITVTANDPALSDAAYPDRVIVRDISMYNNY